MPIRHGGRFDTRARSCARYPWLDQRGLARFIHDCSYLSNLDGLTESKVARRFESNIPTAIVLWIEVLRPLIQLLVDDSPYALLRKPSGISEQRVGTSLSRQVNISATGLKELDGSNFLLCLQSPGGRQIHIHQPNQFTSRSRHCRAFLCRGLGGLLGPSFPPLGIKHGLLRDFIGLVRHSARYPKSPANHRAPGTVQAVLLNSGTTFAFAFAFNRSR
jgi:hypothetical protein